MGQVSSFVDAVNVLQDYVDNNGMMIPGRVRLPKQGDASQKIPSITHPLSHPSSQPSS